MRDGVPSGATGAAAGLRHEALPYADGDGLAAGTRRFVQEGLAAGEPVLVSVPATSPDRPPASSPTPAGRAPRAARTACARAVLADAGPGAHATVARLSVRVA